MTTIVRGCNNRNCKHWKYFVSGVCTKDEITLTVDGFCIDQERKGPPQKNPNHPWRRESIGRKR